MTIPFLGGLARAAGAAAPYAANTLAAKNAAAAQGLQQQRQQQLQMLMLAMQQRKQATADALAQAQTSHYNAETKSLLGKRNIMRGPGGQLVDATDPAHPVPIGPPPASKPDPVAVHQQNRLFDVKHPLPQQPTNVYLPSLNKETGETDYTVVPNRGPVNPRSTGLIKPPTGAGGASGSMAPVADMEQRYGEIAQHAQDLASGKWKFDRSMQTREGLEYGIARENAGGEKVPLTQSIAAGAMDMFGVGRGNKGQDYAQYQALMNSTRALGDDVAKVFKGRQNEEAVLREVALAELTPDDYQNPTVVQQKLSRLRHVIGLARAIMPAGREESPMQPPASAASGVQSGNIDLREPTPSHTAPKGAPKAAPTGFDPEKFYRDYTSKKRSP